MADVRCPMCGKPNPASAEICQFCQARIKPLYAPPADAGSPGGQEPDWLSGLRPGEGDFGPEASSEREIPSQPVPSDLPDWLSRLGPPPSSAGGEPSPFEPDEPETPAAMPDWLSAATPTASGDPNVPDWMEELGVSPPQATPPPTSRPASGEPEWLRRVRARQTADEEKEAGSEGEPAPGATPDWLSSLGQEAAPAEEGLPEWLAPEGAPPAPQKEAPPDWLSDLGKTAAAPAEALPEWLAAGAPGVPPPAAPEFGAEAPPTAPEATPDWLSGLGVTPFDESLPVSAGEEPTLPSGARPPAGGEAVPDWIARLGAEAAPKPGEGAAPAFTPAFTMDEEEAAAFGVPEAEAAELAALPEWVAGISAEQAPPEAAPPSEAEAAPGLAPALLPSWLEAMRPVEAAAPTVSFRDETDTHVESAGPLAGLRGVLPAEAEIARYRKPPVYSVKLQVSEAQQAHVALLEDLIKSESQAKAIAPRFAIAPQHVLRVVVALALFLAVFWTLWTGGGLMSLPDKSSVPEETKDLYSRIEALPLGSNVPVLVAFDYEPGLSGEMEAAAMTAVEHLLSRQVSLSVVSTSPTGPALAERMIGQIEAQQNVTYTVANLGYLPGGAAGLLSFAESPAQVTPYALDGADVWAGQPATLTLADYFALVMVITDNPDTARAWIEQVQPSLQARDRPLMMVVSAQAEPMVRPYYESSPRQVTGMVGGLAGGARYEVWSSRGFLSKSYWDSFSAGILVAVAFIVIGGLINIASAWLAGLRQKGEA